MGERDAETQAISDDRDKTTAKLYHSKDGTKLAYKTYLDAKSIDPRITLDWVRGWFKNNVERTRQVGGARNSYVAPHAFFEYQADLFFATDRQFQNQNYPAGLSMIPVFQQICCGDTLKREKR